MADCKRSVALCNSFGCYGGLARRCLKKPLKHIWLLPGAMALFVLFFFRNPERKGKAEEKELLSPADGKIMSVTKITDETEYLKGPARKISIFLSLFDVHINRSPIAGVVGYVRYQPGKFLPAYKKQAPHVNERNYMGLENRDGQKILLVQIVGRLARRVVCWSKAKDQLARGERFGLMKFGSCVELYVPAETELYAAPGQKVKGGVTILGRLP